MTHYPVFTSPQPGSSCVGIASGGHQLENTAEFVTGAPKLQTVVYSDFLDPFLPSMSQKKYFQVPGREVKALTAELKLSYRTRTRLIDMSTPANIKTI